MCNMNNEGANLFLTSTEYFLQDKVILESYETNCTHRTVRMHTEHQQTVCRNSVNRLVVTSSRNYMHTTKTVVINTDSL